MSARDRGMILCRLVNKINKWDFDCVPMEFHKNLNDPLAMRINKNKWICGGSTGQRKMMVVVRMKK